ncbi:Arachidonate 5-lipoxygenase [Datura stramonium]|uniref:Arachidonate 5-lipoxygenase n=1 Tax=Datura stramonium TaxID=4076 RepID=A0ABS8RIF0_DATST|nr:Arachidonate 5-lipoxygenase [Datura stramonium]
MELEKAEEWDRVYDYAYYNDLGDPDKGKEYARPVLGGSSEYPFEALFDKTPSEFDSFEDVLKLYEGGIKLPSRPLLKAIIDSIPLEILKDILQTDGQGILKYPTPQVIQEDKSAWRTDEEFGREMLAGVNPVLISRLQEFPPKSKLDPDIYGSQNSTITKVHIEDKLDGLTVDEAIKTNRLFILNHHDIVMPYLRRINTPTSTKTYASRTLIFLKDNGTLKPLAIELSLPHPNGDQFGIVGKVYTIADQGKVEGSSGSWPKAYAAAPSVLHPIHKLLHPHFHDTMNINAFARQTLINGDGFVEKFLFPAKYSMEMSARRAVDNSSSFTLCSLTIQDYPYAVDGLKIWSAIKSWVTEYCNFYYNQMTWYRKIMNFKPGGKKFGKKDMATRKMSLGGLKCKLCKSS